MNDTTLREHLAGILAGKGAHLDLQAALSEYPGSIAGSRVPGVSHTPWRLLEHMRIAQWDILEFSRSIDHVSPSFPDGYWPEAESPPTASAWAQSVKSFLSDLQEMQALVLDAATDLYTRIPWGDGQTVLREALVLADHNSYHLGQLILLGKALGRL